MSVLSSTLNPGTRKWAIDLGLLILRAGTAFLMLPHGWNKIQSFGEKAHGFYNFMHLGGEVSMAMVIFAEFFCSILLFIGLGTRLILIPLIFTMSMVVFVINANQPMEDKESGFLYLIPYVVLFFTGPGRISLDHLLFRKKSAVIVK